MENVDGAVEGCRTFQVLYIGVECRNIILSKYIYKKNFLRKLSFYLEFNCLATGYYKQRGN